MTLHLLDANVFIEAKNRYYHFEICPGFWDWMDHIVAGKAVGTITKVRDELLNGKDELAAWVKHRKNAPWFLPEDDTPTQRSMVDVAAWVHGAPCTTAAKAEFMKGADPWLVAKARALGAIVVTHEKPNPNAKARILLPNVCNAFGVPYLDTFDMLRALSASFVYQPAVYQPA